MFTSQGTSTRQFIRNAISQGEGKKDLFVIDDGEEKLCLLVLSDSKPRDGYWISGTEGALVAD